MIYKVTLAILCVGMLAGIGRTQDQVGSVEGKWERRSKDEVGKSYHFIKQHKDGQTIHTVYDENGGVLVQHISQYKLRNTEDVHVFTTSNTEITAGPNKGQKVAGPQSYAYRIQGDSLYEFWGVLQSQPATPGLIVWTRVKEE